MHKVGDIVEADLKEWDGTLPEEWANKTFKVVRVSKQGHILLDIDDNTPKLWEGRIPRYWKVVKPYVVLQIIKDL